ncbi:FecR family protein [bacterium]|nr:FecR family protein [bacterium]
MKPIKTAVIIMIVILAFVPASYALNAVATLTAIFGDVKLQRVKDGVRSNEPGQKGMILEDKDLVITGPNARTTLLFRDGSEIRLFQNTEFMIEKTIELKGVKKRGFFNSFQLNMGSFWGKFTKNRQKTTIKTPTATCGIKGTSVSFSERNGQLNVSLSTGAIELENEDEKILLKAGKMIEGITRTGSFNKKVKDLPYFIEIKPDNNKIIIPTKGNTSKINITIQMMNVKTKQNVERSGRVYLSLETVVLDTDRQKTDKIVFPENITLNDRGFARFTAQILPFNEGDYGRGKIEILAIVEGEDFMNVGAGQTMLSYDIPQKLQKTVNIKANTGEVN